MKKILCFLFAVLMIASTLSLAVSAASEPEILVMEELDDLFIDGNRFDEKNYPVNKSNNTFEVLTVVESNFITASSSPEYALFLYVYNPACVEIKDNSVNSVQLGFDEDCKEFSYYAIQLMSKTADNRFVKFKVVDSTNYAPAVNCIRKQASNLERIYNVVSFRIWTRGTLENGTSVERLVSYGVDKAFLFSGYDYEDNYTLSCRSCRLGALTVELKTTNWISPNVGERVNGEGGTIYDHYEINSVYFTVPKEFWDGWEYLKSVHAIYDALRLTPIILTRSKDFESEKGLVTKNAILEGTDLDSADIDVMDLYAATDDKDPARWLYTENDYLHTLYAMQDYPYRKIDSLAYYFECLDPEFDYDKAEIWKAVVGSEELQAYFYDLYNDPLYDNDKLYTECKKAQEITLYSRDFDETAFYDMKSFSSTLDDLSVFEKWFLKFSLENDGYLWRDFEMQANHIDVLRNWNQLYEDFGISSSSSDDAIAEALHIGVNDVELFKKDLEDAIGNDEYVVLMRFAITNYRCLPVHDKYEVVAGLDGPIVALGVEKWAFMNLNVMDLTFYNEGEELLVPVSSNTVDSFGDLDAAGDPNLSVGDLANDAEEWWEKVWAALKQMLKWIVLILALLLFAPVIVWVVRFVLGRVKKTAKVLTEKKDDDSPHKRE